MANDIALGIVIGGAVSATFGKAVTETSSRIVGLRKTADTTRLWQRTIGDTVKLQDEFRRLHAAGDNAAEGIRRKIDTNLRSLREAGVEVDRLDRSYQRLGRTARGLDLQAAGRERIASGREGLRGAVGDTVKFGAAVAVPATISANYQAIIRDIALKAGIARTEQEASMGIRIRRDATANGINRNELAEAVNQMVAGGMDVDRALDFAPLVAKFSVGQGATSVETAKMIQSLQQNAKIVDLATMSKALEAIAFLGKAGSFESADMARWFPVLLAEMQKIGITGEDSVTQLGAMLQVQMKTAGNADEAANNLKNWFSKIGSNETAANYKKAGVDYDAKMQEAINKGWSTLEASFVLARAYIERTDPAKAKQLANAAQSINGEADPAKRKTQIAAFEDTMKTGDLFNDMQVKAALTAYLQNADMYQQLKKDSAQASGEIAKDLADRRDASKQVWSEVTQQWNDAMRSIGDALRPVTDLAGQAAKATGEGLAKITDSAPQATLAVAGVAASFIAYRGAKSLFQIGRGAIDVARGVALVGRRGTAGAGGGGVVSRVAQAMGGAVAGGVQRVFVVNFGSGGLDSAVGATAADRGARGVRGGGARAAGRAASGAGTAARSAANAAGTAGATAAGGGLAAARRAANNARIPARPEVGGAAQGSTTGAGRAANGSAGGAAAAGRAANNARLAARTAVGTAGAGAVDSAANGAANAATQGGRFARLSTAARGLVGRVMPYAGKLAMAGTVLKLGMVATNAYGVATSDEGRAEKAKGFGGIAGSLAGGVLGAKVGAAIGALGGPIGVAIGGLAGGVVGAYAGEKALGAVSKWVFAEKPALKDPAASVTQTSEVSQAALVSALAKSAAPVKPLGADKPVMKIDQTNTFAPVFHVQVNGEPSREAADRFLDQVSPRLQRMMADQAAKNNRSSMFDSAHN
ncbi:phage tail tape measure protein [Caballeronia sp. dw_19]|uniref:phage tail tape measure protein n=1 Tax=Caballeronia sp. dw_19 TaxID=2719791 RepID=UPI001BD43815|nr:phage tail tape measure protein [Caballeronia sp. dw_19]